MRYNKANAFVGITVNSYLCQFDYVKLIMAIFVVALHTHPLCHIDDSNLLFRFFNGLAQIAVPFFFISSGYFLFFSVKDKNDKEKSQAVFKYFKRILITYGLWSLIYLPISIYGYLSEGASLVGMCVSLVRNLLFVGSNFCSWQFWYLLSTIWGVLAIFVLRKYIKKTNVFIVFAIIAFALSQLINYFVETQTVPIITKFILVTIGSGRIFEGFYYISVGMVFAERKSFLAWWISFPLFAVLFVASVLTGSELLAALSYVAFFEIVMSVKVGENKVAAKVARKMSSYIYYVHMLVVFAIYCLSGFVFNYGPAMFVISTVISVGISIAFLALSKHKSGLVKYLM